MARTAAVAEETANKLGVSGRKAGEQFASGLDSGTSKLGSVFGKAAATASSFGIPLAGALDHVGWKLDTATAQGHGLSAGRAKA